MNQTTTQTREQIASQPFTSSWRTNEAPLPPVRKNVRILGEKKA